MLHEACDIGIFDINICGGEPFMHPRIFHIIGKIVELGFCISLNTNACLIDEDTAEKLAHMDVIKGIQVSIDSHLKQVHNATRGSFDETLAGLRCLCKYQDMAGATPTIGIVVNKHNYATLIDTISYFERYTNRFHLMNVMSNPGLSLSPDQQLDYTERVIPGLREVADSDGLFISSVTRGEYGSQDMLYSDAHIDCLAGFTSLVVGVDFSVYPCDIAPTVLGKWHDYGDLQSIYNETKSKWKRLDKPWCCFV